MTDCDPFEGAGYCDKGLTPQERRAFECLGQIEHDVGELGDMMKQAILDAVAKETRRCLAFLRAVPKPSKKLIEAIDCIEHYDESPDKDDAPPSPLPDPTP